MRSHEKNEVPELIYQKSSVEHAAWLIKHFKCVWGAPRIQFSNLTSNFRDFEIEIFKKMNLLDRLQIDSGACSQLGAGGKPSTKLPPGGLSEH
jgi:hypothetical protein